MSYKRLSIEQKLAGVRIVLFNALYPMSAQEIAQKLGMKRGSSVSEALQHLLQNGEVAWEQHGSNLGKTFVYWRLTPEIRKELRRQGWKD